MNMVSGLLKHPALADNHPLRRFALPSGRLDSYALSLVPGLRKLIFSTRFVLILLRSASSLGFPCST